MARAAKSIQHDRTFGSWLTATARPDSDVDLCIVMKRKTCQSDDFDSGGNRAGYQTPSIRL